MAPVKTHPPADVTAERTVRRRGGTQPAPLSVDDVMDAALAITRRSGLDALTVKAVADELGVTSPAVYHYLGGKRDLLDRVCGVVLRRVDLRVDATAPWQDQIVSIMLRMHHAFARYPGVGTRALFITGPATASERISAVMRDIVTVGGFAAPTADEVVAALHLLFSGWLVGKVPDSSPPVTMTPELLERTTRRLLAGYSAMDLSTH